MLGRFWCKIDQTPPIQMNTKKSKQKTLLVATDTPDITRKICNVSGFLFSPCTNSFAKAV